HALRPGVGTGVCAHARDVFIGQLFRVNGRHVPPPEGVRSPIQWGAEVRLRELFGCATRAVSAERRHDVFRHRASEAFVAYWKRFYGPTLKAFESVGDTGGAALERDLIDLIDEFNRATDGTRVVPTAYVEAVIVVR